MPTEAELQMIDLLQQIKDQLDSFREYVEPPHQDSTIE